MFSILIKVPPRYNQRPRAAKSAEILKETKTTVVPVNISLHHHCPSHNHYIYHYHRINMEVYIYLFYQIHFFQRFLIQLEIIDQYSQFIA